MQKKEDISSGGGPGVSSYIGRHAELYDLFYADKQYSKEADFIHKCLQHYSKKMPKSVLELACGTGSHAFSLEKLGYQIFAIDNSHDMLECAKRKAYQHSSKITFYEQDMQKFQIPDEKFDSAICLFDSIGYVLTNTAIEQVFSHVHLHLKENGLFVFEFWHSAAMVKKYDPLRVRRYKYHNKEIIRISETELDYTKNVAHVKYTILESNNNGDYKKIEETQNNRFFSISEMTLFLKNQNFEPIKFFDGYTYNETITDDTWHIVAIVRRK